jgi:hypothetical protein
MDLANATVQACVWTAEVNGRSSESYWFTRMEYLTAFRDLPASTTAATPERFHCLLCTVFPPAVIHDKFRQRFSRHERINRPLWHGSGVCRTLPPGDGRRLDDTVETDRLLELRHQ